MKNEKFQEIAENLFVVVPLFKKKFIRYDMYKEHINLSPSHFHILFILDDMGKLPITEIAKLLNISKTNVTPLIQKLVNKDFVTRITSEEDRRYINIDITTQGKAFLANHKLMVMDDLGRRISGFSDLELEKLSNALKDIKELISKID